jgi:hypothetical protein
MSAECPTAEELLERRIAKAHSEALLEEWGRQLEKRLVAQLTKKDKAWELFHGKPGWR